ncbi:uncharacterized protein LOC128550843 [Mercenaria mercenaria]|uniref:uncharacterized protein LOC128550843 n=1 Tax=Mercenaria mercenaria TaxID=6596 RepID=UPI00234F5644|nr:uncharacterized protein LOC128550843 [Mercenaria mercenaria]
MSDYSDEEESDFDEHIELGRVVDVDQRVRQYLDSLPASHSDESEESSNENDENRTSPSLAQADPDLIRVRQFKSVGCGCQRNCHACFEIDELHGHILNIREMEKQDKEMYIMATLADSRDKENTKKGRKRVRFRHDFKFQGKFVCRKTFMLVFDIGKHSLQNIMTHVNKNGVAPRIHGNTGRKTAKSLVFEDIKRLVQFVSNYADDYGMPQPAAPRGGDNIAPIYLTSETTKMNLHEKYVNMCAQFEPTCRSVKYSTFCNIWTHCLPHIRIATPRDDVCATCEKMRKAIVDSVTEEEKIQSASNFQNHVTNAQKERQVYNDCIKMAKESYQNENLEKYVHYTFDFCQNVSIPHHSRQMGPLYFLTLRKVQIFGFRIDRMPKQLNFLIDENETIGKDGTSTHGPNAVISMIDYAMNSYSTGETKCAIHADNCPGQNKNQYVIGYFMWRVMTGRHQEIEYHMQIPGHARCLVDSGFASLKKLYRRTDCDSLVQLQHVVDMSSATNEAVRYPSWQWRDWKSFLGPVIKPMRGIR